ncbi:MAG: hypothetical protein QOF21_1585 [Actinomycetota bacterium]|jgi:acyl-CoA synthetase (AMP-forming)/AMP-acid ligase II
MIWRGPALADWPGIGALTMGAFLDEVAERFDDNEALVFDDPLRGGDTIRLTYADLYGAARAVAKAMLVRGVLQGERVAIVMGNRPEAVASLFGTCMVGATAVPLSTFATQDEIGFMLADADVHLVLTQTEMLGRRYADEIRNLHDEVVAVGDDEWDAFIASGDVVSDATLDAHIWEADEDDDALIIYSSGTTAKPKGILHGHRSPTLQFWIQSQLFRRTERTRLWMAFPIFWTAGLNTGMGALLASGGCWVMQEAFEPHEALALMARERVTEPYCLPHQIGALAELPEWETTDLSSLKYVFGKSAFARHPKVDGDTNWQLPVGYGLSETCAYFVAHPADAGRDALKSSTGRLLPGNELTIDDDEFCIKGPTLMKHYVGKTPAECFDAEGFFHTGDTGLVDDDEFVHFTGRRSEMIKTGGANVSPAELEVALRACPPVKLARVVGMPDATLDEVVVACVTLKDGVDATAEDIQAFLRERVASYKVPKRVLFFADGEIPMTASDTKVRDAELVALVSERMKTT